MCPTISMKGQASHSPHADATRRGQKSDNTGRKGAAISTNEAGGLKAFYFEAARPPGEEQSVQSPWFPGTASRKWCGGRSRGGILEQPGAEIDPEREVEGLLSAKWSFPLLTPLQNPGSGSAPQPHPALVTGPSPPFQCP